MASTPITPTPRLARLIGGTGRSGTSILAHMVAAHPEIVLLSEPRFLADPSGLTDLAEGRVSLAQCEARFRKQFQARINKQVRHAPRELEDPVLSEDRLVDLFRYAATLPSPEQQAAWIARAILDGLADQSGATGWVEKTPNTVEHVDTLHRMFGDLRYVHILRDPRATAASMFEQAWGPNTVDEFIQRYTATMIAAQRAMNGAPGDAVFVVTLEDLSLHPRVTLQRVLDHLDLTMPEQGWNLALDRIKPENGHLDRWRQDLSEADAARIEKACRPLHDAILAHSTVETVS